MGRSEALKKAQKKYMEKIKAEIAKCDLLCISCHHKEHGLK